MELTTNFSLLEKKNILCKRLKSSETCSDAHKTVFWSNKVIA